MADQKELSIPKFNWRLLLVLGVVITVVGIGVFIYGLNLRSEGENFSQYWMLAALALWGGLSQIQKGFQRKPAIEKKPS